MGSPLFAQVELSMASHWKTIGMPNESWGLWLRALLMAHEQRTEGFIPEAFVARLGGLEAAADLVERGLWERVDGGWRIHDFVPIRTAQDRGREGGKRSAAARRERFGTAQPPKPPEAAPKRSRSKPEAPSKHSRSSPNQEADADADADADGDSFSVDASLRDHSVEGTAGAAPGGWDWVGTFVDEVRKLGLSDPTSSVKGRIGKAAKELDDGKRPAALIHEAIREVARRNCSPALLAAVYGDVERDHRGISRAARPVVKPLAENPIDRRNREFSERLLGMEPGGLVIEGQR